MYLTNIPYNQSRVLYALYPHAWQKKQLSNSAFESKMSTDAPTMFICTTELTSFSHALHGPPSTNLSRSILPDWNGNLQWSFNNEHWSGQIFALKAFFFYQKRELKIELSCTRVSISVSLMNRFYYAAVSWLLRILQKNSRSVQS